MSRYILDTQELLTQRPFYRQQLLPTLLKQAYPTLVPAAHPSRGAREEAWRRPPYPRALRSLECAYLGDEGPGQRTVRDWQLRQLFGDQAFVWGTLRYLQQFATYQPSFLYYMDHQVGGGSTGVGLHLLVEGVHVCVSVWGVGGGVI